jgi:hypothetical protein
MSETPLTESLWWVIPNRLGGMRKPTPEEIPTLKLLPNQRKPLHILLVNQDSIS